MNLRVGFKTFRVRPMTQEEREETGYMGFCKKNRGVIAVDPAQDPEEQADTLMHELLHAAWFVGDLPAKADEEKAVTVLAHVLCQVVRDNPALMGALRAGLEGSPIVKGSAP